MPSTSAVVAEAVKLALNAAPSGTFSTAFTARRVYVPYEKVEALGSAVNVVVVTKSDAHENIGRRKVAREITVDIGVLKRLTPTADPAAESGNTEIDPLMALAEEIAGFWHQGELGKEIATGQAPTGAQWARTSHEPPYSVADLKDSRLFISLITVTFTVFN